MLNNGTITANLPAADLGRARAFYADKLGLKPSQEFEGFMLVYHTTGGSTFSIYHTDSRDRPVTRSLSGMSTTSTRPSPT